MFSEKGDQRLKVRMKPIWILMKLRRRVRPLRPPWSWPTASVVTVIYSGSALHVAVQSLIHVWLRNHGLQHTRLPRPSSPELAQIHIHWVCEAIQLSHPLSSPSPPAPNPSSIRVFSNELTLRMQWPKYWSFSFSISPSNDHPGLISFRRDWLDLLAVQGTLKSLLQHHTSKASILWHSFLYGPTHIHTWLLEKP